LQESSSSESHEDSFSFLSKATLRYANRKLQKIERVNTKNTIRKVRSPVDKGNTTDKGGGGTITKTRSPAEKNHTSGKGGNTIQKFLGQRKSL
jgi:hypothetical protein